jgi:metal-responsive CopG/Arc/MetJ family transcriptional regulator
MKRTRNCKRVNDAIKLFKLPASLLRRIQAAAKREHVSASKLIRTAVVRLLADLAAGKGNDIVWR